MFEGEIDRLANYLLTTWSSEIGVGDPIHGESAVDVAIRLLERLFIVEILRQERDG